MGIFTFVVIKVVVNHPYYWAEIELFNKKKFINKFFFTNLVCETTLANTFDFAFCIYFFS